MTVKWNGFDVCINEKVSSLFQGILLSLLTVIFQNSYQFPFSYSVTDTDSAIPEIKIQTRDHLKPGERNACYVL